jgi:hypothetical protein
MYAFKSRRSLLKTYLIPSTRTFNETSLYAFPSILQYAGGEFNATINSYNGSLPGLQSFDLASGRIDIDGSNVTFHWTQDPPFPPEFVVQGTLTGNVISVSSSLNSFSVSDNAFGACVFANGSLNGTCNIINENTLECVLDVSGDIQQHTAGNFCNAIQNGANLHFELALTRK